MFCVYITSFETNIQITNLVFEYPNIRIFYEYSNIRLSPTLQYIGLTGLTCSKVYVPGL